jgi:CBS-domain-containing membrane protein
MRAADIMTRDVICVTPEETIDTAIDLMLSKHISGLPVIDDKQRLVGMLTEGDLLRRSEIGTQRERSWWRDAFARTRGETQTYLQSHGGRVKDVMTRTPVVVAEDTPLDEIVRLMETRHIKRLPVTRDSAVIGVVGRADVLAAVVKMRREAKLAPADDKRIRQQILDNIAAQDWAAGAVVDVMVRKGAADLWGEVLDVRQAEALSALVESTPGIQHVEIYLTCGGEVVIERGPGSARR